MGQYQRPLDYIDVAQRLREMREKFPDLSMQQIDMRFVEIGGRDWVLYTAAAYRNPDDPRPGIGTAWEPIPGPTPYTRDSEVQNAETAAWGRALVAIGADTKNGIASAEEVTNRTGGDEHTAERPQRPRDIEHEDPRIAPILKAGELGTNSFVSDIAKKYIQYGSLSENQISKAFEAAQKLLSTPRSAPNLPDEEPF